LARCCIGIVVSAWVLGICCEPVAAFTVSRAASTLGVHRHDRILKKNNKEGTPAMGLASDTAACNNTNNNEEHDGGGESIPTPPSVKPLSSLLSPIRMARSWKAGASRGYSMRMRADPAFFQKSIVEVLVAAGTQLMAEWNRRGAHRMVPELDFIVPAVLAAVFGKYYSMWRTAKTLDNTGVGPSSGAADENEHAEAASDPVVFGRPVPTNAFQPCMADGSTVPSPDQRLGSFLAPVPALFRAGAFASGIGYGIVAVLVDLRTRLVHSYASETIPVNVLYASVYTGCFMAVVSNIRYQILQGLVEPILIDRWIFSDVTAGAATKGGDETGGAPVRRRLPMVLRSFVIFAVRWLNGLLGSVLAINGMRMCGLQRMK